MPLDDGTLGAVRNLVKRCTAYVSSPGKTGSGFFIDRDLLLTCAHVVGAKGSMITVQPFGEEARDGEVIAHEPGPAIDLALVRVPNPLLGSAQPAVVLDRQIADGATYFAVGYPKNVIIGDAGQEEIAYHGHGRRVDDEVTLLDLEAGQASVTPGLSGGPVVSSESGTVVAIVQYRGEAAPAAGGGAIPIGRAAATFEQVQALLAEPPVAAREWRGTLGRDRWLSLGHEWGGWAVRVDVKLLGDRREWTVRIQATGAEEVSETYNVRNLPDEIPTGLFNWAERRRIGDRKEAALVGRLLSGAMLPIGITPIFSGTQQPDDVLVRLEVDASSQLFDVPWEFMTVGDPGSERHLATEDGFGFARIVPREAPNAVDIGPAFADAAVLGIVVQPPAWDRQMPVLRLPDRPVDWPKSPELVRRLERAVAASQRLKFRALENPTPNDLEDAVRDEMGDSLTLEVVHYVGFGKTEAGEAKIAMLNTRGDVEWRAIEDLFEAVHQSGARFLLVEFLLPRSGTQPEPVRPSAFKAALRGRLNAIVLTQFPTHPDQIEAFDEDLYKGIGLGLPIEKAVQHARRVVYRNGLWDNPAMFGSFALITGPRSEMTLLSATTTTAKQMQPAPAVAPAAAGASTAARRQDDFRRTSVS